VPITIDLAIERPESNELGDLVRSYYTMMRVLGFDLGLTAHAALSPSLGAQWFLHFIADRKLSDPKRYPANHQYDYRDPALVLKDYAHQYDSPYREAFGYSESMGLTAKKIVWTRNLWFHFGEDPGLDDLIEIAQHVRSFTEEAGLASRGQVISLLNRLQRIKTGQYQPKAPLQKVEPQSVTPSAPQPEVEAMDATDELTTAVVVPDDMPRPRIGGVWFGEIPSTRYKITKTGDVVDPDTFESLRNRVGGSFTHKVKQWFAVPPRGGEVWVASDGAIGGWINEFPRLLGYLGNDPVDESARGFLLPHFYETRSGAIVDLGTGDTLAIDIASDVDEGTVLRVTTYGDVITFDQANGVERIATVAAEDWFPGHLG
jgi:hypothetical protein